MSNGALNSRARRLDWIVWGGIALTAAVLLLAYLLPQLQRRARLAQPLPVYGHVAPFSLTNQAGAPVSLDTLRGHVWVADIIFTRCAGPCPVMTRQMQALQEALPPGGAFRLVTLTTDADYDTPPVLQAYAERYGADTNRWLFLTGPKEAVARLAIDSLKLTALAKKPEERLSPEDLFVHSTIFVLVDQQGRLRGIFESAGPQADPLAVKNRILAAARQLEREPSP
jgi:protein SCO1